MDIFEPLKTRVRVDQAGDELLLRVPGPASPVGLPIRVFLLIWMTPWSIGCTAPSKP